MSASWIAGDVRALGLATANISDVADHMAAARDLDAALGILAQTAWSRGSEAVATVETAQRRTFEALLWQLRVLAGWLPSEGVEIVLSCVAWFEIRNVEDRLAYFAGAPAEAPYELGRLGMISKNLTRSGSAAEIRRLMVASAWGDPGADDEYTIRIWMRRSWHHRVRDASPELRVWADAAAWLFQMRERMAQRPGHAMFASTPPSLPSTWRWVVSTQWSEDDLWRAEQRWWVQVRNEGLNMLHQPVGRRGPVLGALATLASSARRIATALEIASGGGSERRLDVLG